MISWYIIGWKMREFGYFLKNLKIIVNKGKKKKGEMIINVFWILVWNLICLFWNYWDFWLLNEIGSIFGKSGDIL